jgi:hypothetical protein
VRALKLHTASSRPRLSAALVNRLTVGQRTGTVCYCLAPAVSEACNRHGLLFSILMHAQKRLELRR